MKPSSRTRRVVAVSSLLVIGLLLIVLRPAPLPVDAGRVSRGSLEVTLEEEGFTRVVDRFTISAPVSGSLKRMTLSEGDPVTAGMPVASILPPRLDAREYREASSRAGSAGALSSQAASMVRQADIRLAQARLKAGRHERLYREGAVSKESYELAAEEAAVLEREARASKAAFLAARLEASARTARVDPGVASRAVEVRSPDDGKVLRIFEKSERIVGAGTPLLEIGNPGMMEVVIDVLSSDAVRVRPGDRVWGGSWGGSGSLPAVVKRIEPAAFTKTSALGIEEKRVNVIATLEKPEPRLGDNYRIQAMIVLERADNVLRVPVSSLFRESGGWKLFVIDGGRARLRAVRIGMTGADFAEVLSGVREGEAVVVHPPNELEPDMRVHVR